MEQDYFMTFVTGMLFGVLVGGFIVGISMTPVIINAQNRALSCMANNMTIEQCQDVLGIK